MTVGEMKRLLETLDDDLEVRLAHQPSWPLQYTVADVVEAPAFDEDEIEDEIVETADAVKTPEDAPRFAYVIEGSQVYDDPYLPYSVRAAIGWG